MCTLFIFSVFHYNVTGDILYDSDISPEGKYFYILEKGTPRYQKQIYNIFNHSEEKRAYRI